MLNKKTKALMKTIYTKAIDKNGSCLLNQIDILQDISYKLDFSFEDLDPCLKALTNEGYFEMIETEKNSEKYYCITLLQPGYEYSRQIASEKRAIKLKIILTVSGVILSFILTRILAAIAGN